MGYRQAKLLRGLWPGNVEWIRLARNLSKRLPMSTDLEQVLRRDDDHYDVNAAGAAVTAKSGVAAARALLGMSEGAFGAPPAEEPAIEHQDPAAGSPSGPSAAFAVGLPPESDGQQYLREAGSLADLKAAWRDIAQRYSAAGVEIPVAIEAVYNERREAFEAATKGGKS